MTAKGSAVAPLSSPQAHIKTRFHKENKLCPVAASRLSAKGAANKESQNYQNKQRGGDTCCPPSAEGRDIPRVKGGEFPTTALSPGPKMQRSAQGVFHCSAKRGRHCTAVGACHGGGAAVCVHSLPQTGEMGLARSTTLGVTDDLERIQAAVCCCSSAIRQYNTLPGSGRVSLLNKGAICVVPPAQCQSGFYSRYFLVPKRGGRRSGIRPILDLHALNKYLGKYKFRMLTLALASLLRLVRQNERFTSVDLKDSYFHIPIYPPHRKYL